MKSSKKQEARQVKPTGKVLLASGVSRERGVKEQGGREKEQET